MEGHQPPLFIRWSAGLYHGLTRLYPRPFRERYAAQMEDVFLSDLERGRLRKGLRGVASVWCHTFLDALATLLLERLSSLRRRGTSVHQYPLTRNHSVLEAKGMFGGLVKDLHVALRVLGRSPGFTVVAVAILALGIGANTTIFTIVHGCFLAPPPHVVAPERLVRANRVNREESTDWWTHPDYRFFRDNSTVFTGLCAYDPEEMVLTLATRSGPQSVSAWYVSDNYFDVLGIRPEAGRLFGLDEGRAPGEPAVVVISDELRRRFFEGDAEVVGSSIRLNGHPFTILGVVPEGFRGSSPVETAPDVFVPLMMHPVLTPSPNDWLGREKDTQIGWLYVLGRLAPRVTLESAQAEMDAVARSLENEFPPPDWSEEGQGVRLSPHYQYDPELRSRLVNLSEMLTAVVGLVLLIACANIAILLLARGSARGRDIGIQLALGARRARIFRQFLVESLLLAAAGGAGGYIVAFWSADLAASAFPFSFGMNFHPDIGVLLFTLSVAAVAAVVFSVAPSFAASRADVTRLIQSRGSGGAHSPLRSSLVVAQVALSIVLVAGAVQFVRSLRNAESVDLGFETEKRLVVTVNLTNHGYKQGDIGSFIVRALERLESLPEVVKAASTFHTPFRGRWQSTVRVERADPERRATFNSVSPGYFETMGIPLLAGRDFTLGDDVAAPLVAVMNEAAARMMWPNEDALGQTFMKSDERVRVVGIAKNARYYELGEAPTPHIYVPELQRVATFTGQRSFVIHTAGEPMSAARRVEDEIHALDPDLAFTRVQTMEDCVERVLGRYRVGATVVSLFGVLALLLSAIGLYGVLSYRVVRRVRTIGIQMALGASQSRIVRSVVGHGFKLFLVGLAVGVPAALASSRFIESYLFELPPRDPMTYATVVLVLAAVASLAALVPAYRASRVHPTDALREE